jgi:hypothetical protein
LGQPRIDEGRRVRRRRRAHFREDELRSAVLEAKSRYEDALRKAFFDF